MSDPGEDPAPETGGGPWVSRGLPGPVVVLIGLAAGTILLGGMRTAQSVLGPALLAVVVAIAVAPLQAWLTHRLTPWVATTVTLGVTFTGVLLFAGSVVWSLYAFGLNVTTYQDELDRLGGQAADLAAEYGLADGQVVDLLAGIDLERAATVALGAARSVYSVVTLLTLALLLLFFLQVDGPSFARRFAVVRRMRPTVAESLAHFASGTRRYLVVTTVFGLIVAVLDVALLVALGVPLAMVWGVLSFVTNFIPTIGLLLGLVPPVVVALLDGGWGTGVAALVGYLLINNVIQTVVQPRFVGDAVGLSMSTAFGSLVVWGFVLGPLGAVLAIPLTLLAIALLDDGNPRHRWITVMLADKPPTSEARPAVPAGATDGPADQSAATTDDDGSPIATSTVTGTSSTPATTASHE